MMSHPGSLTDRETDLVLSYTLCVIFLILVSLENVKKCVLGGCTITSKTKNQHCSRLLCSKKFQTMLILVFEVIVQPLKTHFLTFSSETKIKKITHSDIRIKLLKSHIVHVLRD